MGKIKYQGGLTKLIASKIAKMNKKKFARYIEANVSCPVWIKNDKFIDMDVVSFSSCNDFYEQFLSILSFLRYVGTPNCWTLYSDGSHTDQQFKLLKSYFEFLNVELVDWENKAELKKKCKEAVLPYIEYLLIYAKNQALGKRLFLYLNYEINKPTLFLDSDILCYIQASCLKIILNEKANGWFLPDEVWGCLDSRYEEKFSKQLYQVNGGFLLLNENFSNFSEALEFLKRLENKYEYFSEQTIIHILLKSNGFMPLDPRIFILNSNDQFDFSYLYPREKMAIRHYTGPVRHKMWQRGWKWHLSLF